MINTEKDIISITNKPFDLYKVFIVLSFIFIVIVFYIKYTLYIKGYVTSDIAYYANMLWNTNFYNKLLYSDYIYQLHPYKLKTFFYDHFTPTYILLVPLYKLFPSPITLLVIKTVLPVFTAFLIINCFFYTYNNTNNNNIKWIASLFAIAYLYHPINILATIDTIYGFHFECLIPFFVILTMYFFIQKRFIPYIISYILLLGIRESIPINGILFSIILILYYRYNTDYNNTIFLRRSIWATSIVSMLYILAGLIIVPLLLVGKVGTASSGVVGDILLLKFLQNIELLFQWKTLLLFIPSFLAPEIAILSVPELLTLITKRTWYGAVVPTYGPYDWHSFYILAVFAVAFIVGFQRLEKIQRDFLKNDSMKKSIFYMVLFALLTSIFIGGLKLKDVIKRTITAPYLHNQNSVAEVSKHIPLEASLKTTADLIVYFTNRPHLTWQLEHAEYILINGALLSEKLNPYLYDYDKQLITTIDSLENQKVVSLIYKTADGLFLLKKM
ncbi:MAG: DUF2079 domain-containing protein [Nitrospinae bacterium]|nr:DUF2079 domain-containing protein [Nitrospinota bacterium]